MLSEYTEIRGAEQFNFEVFSEYINQDKPIGIMVGKALVIGWVLLIFLIKTVSTFHSKKLENSQGV